MEFGTGIAKRVTSVEMLDESGAGATAVARKEIAQRMNQLKEQLSALELQRDGRPRGDVYADAMGGKEEVGHPVHHSVHQKSHTSEWRLLTDLSLRRFWISGATKNRDDLNSNDFLPTCHVRSDSCFKANPS